MTTRNEITGDAIRSRTSREYRENYERIFGKKKPNKSPENSETSEKPRK